MLNRWRTVAIGSLLIFAATRTANASGDVFDAVRNNDLESLRAAVAVKQNIETRGPRDVTPLMHAAAFGTPHSLQMLLNAGADANAKDGFGATALIWAAGDAAKAKMLIEHGADVNARTTNGRTPLIVAAKHDGNLPTVKLLLDKGAKLDAADEQGDTALIGAAAANALDTVKFLLERGANPNDTNKGGFTVLMSAAASENPAMIRLLIAKGANVNAANTFAGEVKFGKIALQQMTPLMLAVPHCSPRAAAALLDAGANINAKDSRGMTPLMFAVASDTQNADTVKLLIDRGVDVNLRSKEGETALDWALKYGDAKVIATLRKAGAATSKTYEAPVASGMHPLDAREAVERSVALLQKTNAEFFRQSGCISCHHQGMGLMGVNAARSAGVKVDEEAAAESVKQIMANWDLFQAGLLERMDGPASPDIQVSSVFALIAAQQRATPITDALVVNIAATQKRDGSWMMGGFSRAPLEESNLTRTAMSVRALQIYAFGGRKADFSVRIVKARRWLEAAGSKTTDDKVWRLLGMYWAGSDANKLKPAIAALRKLQRPDGGWSANPNLPSDAYSTGSALYALRTSGALTADDRAYERGVAFLLKTQFEDGSWYVRSRAPKFQPYFESGFPFGPDQWVSSAATAWATMALAPAMRPERSRVEDVEKTTTVARRGRGGE